MKKSPRQWLKKTYRREPVSAFIFTSGLMDAALGGFGERWTLLSLGMVMIMISLSIRWLLVQKPRQPLIKISPRRYLPPANSNLTPLPPLKRKRDYKI